MSWCGKIISFVLISIAILALVSVGLLWRVQNKYEPLVAADVEALSATNVVIVFGAGLTANSTRPSDMLHDRLQTAAEVYHAGKARIILVSGDNRFENYNEPEVMRETLIEEYDVPREDIYADYAGRRTYDTCARAHELWGVRRAILVTQNFHLPRALMTCSTLGIESRGVSASLRPYMLMQRNNLREALAQLKAYFDLYIWSPDYLGGPQEARID